LVAVRDPTETAVGDLLWPVVTRELLIRLEPGEVIRWRGLADVGEVRRTDRHESGLRRAWKLTSADCVITDGRITYRASNAQQLGTAALATTGGSHRPRGDSQPTVLAGQVRFQWPFAVALSTSKVPNVSAAGITLQCAEEGEPGTLVSIVLTMTEKTSGHEPDRVTADVARGLVSEIARFRLAAQSAQLTPDKARQLTMQRDNPTPVADWSSSRWNSLRWDLPGALWLGKAPAAAYRRAENERLDALFEAAVAAMERYQLRGHATDLDTALRDARALLDQAPLDSPDRLFFLNLYAGALAARHERTGDLSDLTSAIDSIREVAKHAEYEAPERWLDALTNLGSLLIGRSALEVNEDDVAEGIAAHEATVAATPTDSADWPGYASNLAVALSHRYPLTDDLADLDRAVELQEQAVASPPSKAPGGNDYFYLSRLGFALLDRHRVNDSKDDLTRAISVLETALELLPREASHRAEVLRGLADARARSQHHDGHAVDLQAAVTAWRDSCSAAGANSQTEVLKAATSWSEAMARQRDWPMVVEACELGLDAADRLFRMQLVREHKALQLERAEGMPARAAYALAKLGELEQAAITLERGRAVLLSEALLRDHTELHQLAVVGHADLRDRYRRAADHLAEFERAGQDEAMGGRAAVRGERSDMLRSAKDELDTAIASIRQIAGYEAFMAPLSYPEITAAAATGPLAYLAATEVGGFALVVDGRPGAASTLAVIWLDELTEATVEIIVEEYLRFYDDQRQHRKSWRDALDSVTRRLWDLAMGPLLAELAAERLTVAAGGLLGLLPLHAAWREDPATPTGRRYALDEALITYTPGARALLAAGQLAWRIRRPDRILVVNDPGLPNSEPEVRAALGWFGHGQQLRTDQVTREAVRAALPGYDVLHFACHGFARVNDPLASKLEVASNGDLTLGELLEDHLPNTRLAVLSACETAVVGGAALDEVIGLPTGLLQAGAAGVVGSLWPVDDAATSALMARFYQLWRGDGLTPDEALRQAQRWVRDTTIRTKQMAFPDIDWTGNGSQSSRDPKQQFLAGARIHGHPTDWAAFLYVGI